MEKGKLTFITGGVRSGKSALAEQLAITYAKAAKSKLHYIACGIPFDKEMQERVDRHQADRQQSAITWKTWEQPVFLTKIASNFGERDTILLDCVTTLLNNYLYTENITDINQLTAQVMEDVFSLRQQADRLFVVSNEVLQDIPYDSPLTQRYQYILGNIHQALVKAADEAILVESGIPVYRKGELG